MVMTIPSEVHSQGPEPGGGRDREQAQEDQAEPIGPLRKQARWPEEDRWEEQQAGEDRGFPRTDALLHGERRSEFFESGRFAALRASPLVAGVAGEVVAAVNAEEAFDVRGGLVVLGRLS